ncbi:MAG: F0F1 ATP synthase subunit A [Lautropia sp.]|nr:F0F1 ATP synthase subunit A [Lautropia sp.]
MATEASHGPANAAEYIVHHLGSANSSGHPQKAIVDFSIINYDTIFWSSLMGILACGLMWLVARRVNSGVPGRFVGAVEFLVEFVNDQARSIIHGNIRYIAPLALTVFVWVVFMNTLDLVPVDIVPAIVSGLGISHYQRILPTADLNNTLAMAIVVLFASLYYGIKIKKAHFFSELLSAPFGAGSNSGIGLIFKPLLWICNFAMQIIEYLSKTVSLGMRLFGNMFAGEMVFMLLALLGALATWWGAGLHFVLGLVWAIFHILIIVLQGFIFMMLTLIYLGQAHDAH